MCVISSAVINVDNVHVSVGGMLELWDCTTSRDAAFFKWSRIAGGLECSVHSCGGEAPVTFHGSVGAGTLWQSCTGEVWLEQQQRHGNSSIFKGHMGVGPLWCSMPMAGWGTNQRLRTILGPCCSSRPT